MNKNYELNKTEFFEIIKAIRAPSFVDKDYIFDIYQLVIEGVVNFTEVQNINNLTINPLEVINYCLGEYIYSLSNRNDKERLEFLNNDSIKQSMASIAADKYLSLFNFSFVERKLTNKYFPPMSSLYIYINFMLRMTSSYKKHDPKTSLIADLFNKSLLIAKCTLDLLSSGFETEAFSNWRTLHECECSLIILEKYQPKIIERYLIHMQYGLAYKDALQDKEKQTIIFNKMKEEMKALSLKSKDIKKYIEYGWLYSINEVKNNESFKLNFRDGLEMVAGLKEYAHRYEMSSEIIHSTPMLIYSNKEYFYYMTLLSLYESFFRLEVVFSNLFISKLDKEQKTKYEQMKKVYYSQLINIHKRETEEFIKWQKSIKNN